MSDLPSADQANLPLDVTGVAQRESWLAHEVPSAEELRPGLWSLPLPIPIPSLRYVICYVFEAGAGHVLVDPGWNSDEAWDAMRIGLARIGTTPEATSCVVATHWHPDHLGLAARIRSVSGAPIALHRLDAARLAAASDERGRGGGAHRRSSTEIGVPEDDAAEFLAAGVDESFLPVDSARPTSCSRVRDLVPTPEWRLKAFWTPGHSPGHLCFLEEEAKLLLSGDHVLPRITPNVSSRLIDTDDENPLADYVHLAATGSRHCSRWRSCRHTCGAFSRSRVGWTNCSFITSSA